MLIASKWKEEKKKNSEITLQILQIRKAHEEANERI